MRLINIEIEVSRWTGSLASPEEGERYGLWTLRFAGVTLLASTLSPSPVLSFLCFYEKKKTKKEAAFPNIKEQCLTKCKVKLIDLLIALFLIIPVTTPTFWKRQTTLNGHE